MGKQDPKKPSNNEDVMKPAILPNPEPAKVKEPEPNPPVDGNQDAKIAMEFMKLGAPLQNGMPDNPQAELDKLRKARKQK